MLDDKNWKVIRKIGSGSFGTVYEIQREEFGHVYKAALKVIHIPPNEQDIERVRTWGMDEKSITEYYESLVKDFVRELELMSQLKGNTNIVSYLDHSVEKKQVGPGWEIQIRMELLTPLNKYMTAYQLSEQDVLRIGIDICHALERCQQYGIIHRDVKIDNIFVSDQGDFKLGDFGIARIAEHTMSGMSLKGTYSYMAPEVYRGDAYGPSVDIYSLGMVLYRLLNNNRLPFMPPYPEVIHYQDEDHALTCRMRGEKLPMPCNASERLGKIVLKACSYDARERYTDAEQMRYELESLVNPKYRSPYPYNSDDDLNESLTDEETEDIFPNSPSPGKKTCPHCGQKLKADDKYCVHCGRSVNGQTIWKEPSFPMSDKPKDNNKFKMVLIGIVAVLVVVIIMAAVMMKNKGEKGSADDTETKKETVTETQGEVETEVQTETQEETTEATKMETAEETVKKVDMSYAEGYVASKAVRMLNEAGFEPIITYEYSETVNRGAVVRASWEADGAVLTVSSGKRTIHCQSTRYIADGSIHYTAKYYTGANGQRTHMERYNPDGSLAYNITFEYNDYGQELERDYYKPDGSYRHCWKSDYNEYGALMSEIKYEKDGTEAIRYEYSYDDEGRMTERREYTNGKLDYVFKMRQYDENISKASYESKIYGNWTYADIYDADGNLKRYAVQEFDEAGGVSECMVYTIDGELAYGYTYVNETY